jgi:hypothetical protein
LLREANKRKGNRVVVKKKKIGRLYKFFQKNKWIKGHYGGLGAVVDPSDGCCLVGAVFCLAKKSITHDFLAIPLAHRLMDALVVDDEDGVVAWNDRKSRTKSQVMKMLLENEL